MIVYIVQKVGPDDSDIFTVLTQFIRFICLLYRSVFFDNLRPEAGYIRAFQMFPIHLQVLPLEDRKIFPPPKKKYQIQSVAQSTP